MSFNNRFVSESELEEQRKLYGGKQKDDGEYDSRTLYERLQENKRIKEESIIEKTKFKPSQGLDKDDIEHYKENEKIENEKKKLEQDEIERELEDFKKSQASNLFNSIIPPQSNSNNNNNNNNKTTQSNDNSLKIENTTTTTTTTDVTTTKRKLVNIKLIPKNNENNNNDKNGNNNDKDKEKEEEEEEESKKKLKTEENENDKNTQSVNSFASLMGNYDNSSEDEE
ncbi:hypothetical protein DDB_G0292874 [Dictyostelium discoideum AX4]|uniref:FAM192A/Fyv6 N-terminal domain-containing protein n=1 Tax=Dictyostelium discoideum TaxID=44689 RepID=Q54CL1_DICDI|nr:hypothetical protein DDB_G0292874 [Dictyostelium discoideum AX4]EAL60986.1 hypothetical protein DDB_G0292874 [Dictyostelium discoideum AX4]|eukprot:XP_629405.1 hypothetical protein DDB_G0292874 [Dictyostelium discoideum AX4]